MNICFGWIHDSSIGSWYYAQKSFDVPLHGRGFQRWDFSVHHSRLLIRSQPTENYNYNIDLIFTAVDYISVPKHFNKLKIDTATSKEHKFIQKLFEREITKDEIIILLVRGVRHFIAAVGFQICKNNMEVFVSGLDL